MANLPQPRSTGRSPRLRLDGTTPAVLRLADGHRRPAALKTISLTGGLLGVPAVFNHGSQVKLMFVTDAGAVLGGVEMLKPVSRNLQPFRFTSLDESSRRRLKTIIPGSTSELDSDAWIEKYRSAMTRGNKPRKRMVRTIVAALMVAALCVGAAVFMHGLHLR